MKGFIINITPFIKSFIFINSSKVSIKKIGALLTEKQLDFLQEEILYIILHFLKKNPIKLKAQTIGTYLTLRTESLCQTNEHYRVFLKKTSFFTLQKPLFSCFIASLFQNTAENEEIQEFIPIIRPFINNQEFYRFGIELLNEGKSLTKRKVGFLLDCLILSYGDLVIILELLDEFHSNLCLLSKDKEISYKNKGDLFNEKKKITENKGKYLDLLLEDGVLGKGYDKIRDILDFLLEKDIFLFSVPNLEKNEGFLYVLLEILLKALNSNIFYYNAQEIEGFSELLNRFLELKRKIRDLTLKIEEKGLVELIREVLFKNLWLLYSNKEIKGVRLEVLMEIIGDYLREKGIGFRISIIECLIEKEGISEAGNGVLY